MDSSLVGLNSMYRMNLPEMVPFKNVYIKEVG